MMNKLERGTSLALAALLFLLALAARYSGAESSHTHTSPPVTTFSVPT